MGPRVPFVSNPFGAISPNKVVETIPRGESKILKRGGGGTMSTEGISFLRGLGHGPPEIFENLSL